MRLTLYTDYTLRVMMYLAVAHPTGRVATIDDIAGAYRISRNHLTKIVHELSQTGFIVTTRGRAGGARLARPPARISIGQIVRMAERDFAVVACHDTAAPVDCAILPACNLKRGLARAVDAFMAELDRMTLADAILAPSVAASALGLAASPLVFVPPGQAPKAAPAKAVAAKAPALRTRRPAPGRA